MDKEKILYLPMRKKNALEIVKGEKVREYRAFNDFWATRLCTLRTAEDGTVETTGIKQFDKVRFYPYNNKWQVDCSIKTIVLIVVNQEFLDEFGHEVEAKIGDKLFVIRLDKVLDTNLEIE